MLFSMCFGEKKGGEGELSSLYASCRVCGRVPTKDGSEPCGRQNGRGGGGGKGEREEKERKRGEKKKGEKKGHGPR